MSANNESRKGVGQITLALLRMAIEAFYNYQEHRKASKNQLRNILHRLVRGIPFHQPQPKKKEKGFAKEFADSKLRGWLDYLITQGDITREHYDYLARAEELADHSSALGRDYENVIAQLVQNAPLWKNFLQHVRGVNVLLAGNLIAALGNAEHFEKISAMWAYFGLHIVCPKCITTIMDWQGNPKEVPMHVDHNGKCPKCNMHGIAPKKQKGKGSNWNVQFRTMAWKVANCLMKTGSPVYRKLYDDEKARQLQYRYPEGELQKRYPSSYKLEDTTLTKMHAHNRALRKMVKIFLAHCWLVSREGAGLSVSKPFVQGRLHHEHIITWEQVVEANRNAGALTDEKTAAGS